MRPFDVLRQIAIALAGESVEDLNGIENTITSRLVEAGMLKIENNTLHVTTFAITSPADDDIPIPCDTPTVPGTYYRKESSGLWYSCTVKEYNGVLGYWHDNKWQSVAEDKHTVEWRR